MFTRHRFFPLLLLIISFCKYAENASTLKINPVKVVKEVNQLNGPDQVQTPDDQEDKDKKIKLLKEEHEALSMLPDIETPVAKDDTLEHNKEETMEHIRETLEQNKEEDKHIGETVEQNKEDDKQNLQIAHERTVKAVKLAKALKALESLEQKRKQAGEEAMPHAAIPGKAKDEMKDEAGMSEMESKGEEVTEELNYRVIQKHSGYEERVYFSHQTICITYIEPDVFPSAEEKADDWDQRQGLKSRQLDKLQDYLSGNNQLNVSVVLEWPISVIVKPLKNNTMTRKMCVWISLNKTVPKPLDPELKVEIMDPISTYSIPFFGRVNEFKYRNAAKTLLTKIMADGLGATADFSQYCIKIYDDGIQERENVVSWKKLDVLHQEKGELQNIDAITNKIGTKDYEVNHEVDPNKDLDMDNANGKQNEKLEEEMAQRVTGETEGENLVNVEPLTEHVMAQPATRDAENEKRY